MKSDLVLLWLVQVLLKLDKTTKTTLCLIVFGINQSKYHQIIVVEYFLHRIYSLTRLIKGMMQSGLSRELFESWCTDKKSGVIIAGYCGKLRILPYYLNYNLLPNDYQRNIKMLFPYPILAFEKIIFYNDFYFFFIK